MYDLRLPTLRMPSRWEQPDDVVLYDGKKWDEFVDAKGVAGVNCYQHYLGDGYVTVVPGGKNGEFGGVVSVIEGLEVMRKVYCDAVACGAISARDAGCKTGAEVISDLDGAKSLHFEDIMALFGYDENG